MTTETAPPKHKDGPKFYAVIDVESSGLKTAGRKTIDYGRHIPGDCADCILEVGLIVLDATTLAEVYRNEWLVLPPGVRTEKDFDAWEVVLRERNPFVFEMHTKPSSKDGIITRSSLLTCLRNGVNDPEGLGLPTLAEIELDVFEALRPFTGSMVHDGASDATSTVHPGNSPVVMAGNSVANLDIPLLKLWMPRVHNALSYRIMDVSVLRTFYVETSKVALPPGLAESIKAGASDHRAMADVELCVKNMRDLRAYARGAHEALAHTQVGR